MPVVGTAGHVDHGKSTLIQALTGRDPDRWEEEKRRGLTIDLGFAWTDLDGIEVGFVDVPGHERFIKNMLAGIEVVQTALFVVAADEGWMPQSEEHLAILDLLDITTGVVALTRVDLVDEETAELAALEVEDRLLGTSLQGSPIIPVVAPRGIGIDRLRAALRAAVARSPVVDTGRPRLWIDRSFVIPGAGTVVTGTLIGGGLAVGDQVTLWPGERSARVRSVQSHERSLDGVGPGNRTALNLVGLDTGDVERGAMLGLAGHWLTTRRFLAEVRTVRGREEPLRDRGAYHLHIGSGAWPVRLRVMEGEVPDHGGTVIATLSTPVPAAVGDRFVLRDVGRKSVAAGGRILDPAPANDHAALLASLGPLRAAIDGSPDDRAEALLAVRHAARITDLAAHSGGGSPVTGVVAGNIGMTRQHATELSGRAIAETARFHEENPLRAGIPKATLAERLEADPLVLDMLIAGSPSLQDEGSIVRVTSFQGGWGDEQEQAWVQAQRRLQEHGLAVPRVGELGLDLEMVHALEREGRLVRIDEDLVYLAEQIAEIETVLARLGNGFTVAEFRDAIGASRRQAVPLLEWLDRRGVTVRDGDVRSLRPRRDGPGADGAPLR